MASPKVRLGALIAIGIASMMLMVVTAGALTASQTLPSTGTITAVNLDVYSNSACTTPLTSINWGNVSPGTSVTQTIYIKNTGTAAETLSMAYGNWTPSNAGYYLSISWTPAMTSLPAGNSTSATLTLTATSSAGSLSTFSNNIVITGTQ